MSSIEYIIKRDGSKESFASEKIINAIEKATESLGKDGQGIAEKVSSYVLCEIEKTFANKIPHVEKIQDIIEEVLMQMHYGDIAKAYIIYRHEREKERQQNFFTTYRENLLKSIKKRDGQIVVFDEKKIFNAIKSAADATTPIDTQLNTKLTNQVIWHLNELFPPWEIPEVEDIQDVVEKVLMKNDLEKIARAYILYRNNRACKRK
ncbi:ATP cone domain-containing protein [Candidatus Uabimicrobium amorphum]|uniref:Anaerobic ribonucleoside triphosphate reductase n=1 Tax=Uabimicrobium amorphum TaxID=2596890 RepID=A0A5S9F2B0_UABAM|nr:ATP cone domain-containing protein [Candidatus Uabimicrobium amorphum]BBM82923.1 anaerobic ribonucleoside triphosphate reductase [Candidatus Uabimicrobium amorphum]